MTYKIQKNQTLEAVSSKVFLQENGMEQVKITKLSSETRTNAGFPSS